MLPTARPLLGDAPGLSGGTRVPCLHSAGAEASLHNQTPTRRTWPSADLTRDPLNPPRASGKMWLCQLPLDAAGPQAPACPPTGEDRLVTMRPEGQPTLRPVSACTQVTWRGGTSAHPCPVPLHTRFPDTAPTVHSDGHGVPHGGHEPRGEACTRRVRLGLCPPPGSTPPFMKLTCPTFHSREKQGLCASCSEAGGTRHVPENGHSVSGAWMLTCVTLRGDQSDRSTRRLGVQPGTRVTPHPLPALEAKWDWNVTTR